MQDFYHLVQGAGGHSSQGLVELVTGLVVVGAEVYPFQGLGELPLGSIV